MNFQTIQPAQSISLFIKNILIFEEDRKEQQTNLPFFADGYPGLMFQDTENGLLVSPHNKAMPQFFLYGQTIKPIELVISGTYKLIVFQLYPFVLKSFFGITAKDINDSCYDLQNAINGSVTVQQLIEKNNTKERVGIISNYLLNIFNNKKEILDLMIRQAIQLIIDYKGQVTVAQLCMKVNITERTFERRFLKEVGISPKQFSQITRFQQSLEQLNLKDYIKLTDVVYANGFADQSHFIRVFKAFTGKTPKKFTAKKK